MNDLPKELQDIVYEYKHQLDFSECIKEINNIDYYTKTDWEGYLRFTRNHKNKKIRGYVSPYSELTIFVDINRAIYLHKNETGKIEIEYDDKIEYKIENN